MKKRKRIGLWILLALLIVFGALAFLQRENIRAAIRYLQTDEVSSAQQITENRDKLQSELKDQYHLTVTAPTMEQSDALLEGTLTPDEVKKTLGMPQKQQEQISTKTAQMIVDECTAELYACEVDLLARLGTMKQKAVDEWTLLPKEQQTATKKREIGFAGLRQCYSLEVEIDSQVKLILEKYRIQMKEINGDISVFDTLWEYYCEEKASTKAYYLNKYL